MLVKPITHNHAIKMFFFFQETLMLILCSLLPWVSGLLISYNKVINNIEVLRQILILYVMCKIYRQLELIILKGKKSA